jgi:hypothetical protein
VHHTQHAFGSARLHEQLHQAHRRQGHLLRGLEHKGIAAGDGQRKHPQGQHRRKIEGRDAQADAQGLRKAVGVDATGDVLHGLTHEQRGNVGRVLHHLDAAPDIAFGVLEGLARIAGKNLTQFVVVLLEQGLVTHHQARALGHRDFAPGSGMPLSRWRLRSPLRGGGKGNSARVCCVAGSITGSAAHHCRA